MFDRAVQVVKMAEAELRQLIHEASAIGRYEDVASIAGLAEGLAKLTRDTAAQLPHASGRPEGTAPRLGAVVGSVSSPDRKSLGRTSRSFPRFEREFERLVKIAWSKKDRTEYEHKAPRSVVTLLTERIKDRKGVGARFVAPDIFPMKDQKTNRKIPSYQAYLALAWLVHEGVIVKHGRDGYTLKPTAATSERLQELWDALPSRD